ncbi:MAG: hypothetical protein RL531_1044 [Actinomycetota bacterium]
MTTILTAIETTGIGRPKRVGPVALYPVYWHGPAALPYDTAASAFEAGTLTVEEASSASVPTLLVTNTGTKPVLLTDGEVLEGGWQNRTVVVPVLIQPGEVGVPVPVACVEAGRWGSGDRGFRHAGQRLPRRIRRTISRTVHADAGDALRRVDQGGVWACVDALLEERMTDDSTRSLLATREYLSLDAPVDDFDEIDPRLAAVDRAVRILRTLRPLPMQTGVIVAIGDRCVSAELFDRPETLAAFWDEILASIALDVPKRIDGSRPSVSRALRFLRRVLRAEIESTPGVGLGTEYRFRSDRIAAQGLAVDDRLVCLSVLAA